MEEKGLQDDPRYSQLLAMKAARSAMGPGLNTGIQPVDSSRAVSNFDSNSMCRNSKMSTHSFCISI